MRISDWSSDVCSSDLFAEGSDDPAPRVAGRRSIGTLDSAVRVTTDNYDYHYLCTDLRQKRMIPILTRIRAHSAREFGELVHHQGEEFIYVLEGRIEVHSEYYDPVALAAGEGIYIDSSMGHAYVVGAGCEEALVLGVCSSADDGLMDSLMSLHGCPAGGSRRIYARTDGAGRAGDGNDDRDGHRKRAGEGKGGRASVES